MWEPEGKKKDQNFSLDRKIDLHPNPLIAELLHSAERDWKLAGEPLHWHSRAGISSCRGWRGSWAYPSVAERSPSRSNVSRENRQTAQGFGQRGTDRVVSVMEVGWFLLSCWTSSLSPQGCQQVRPYGTQLRSAHTEFPGKLTRGQPWEPAGGTGGEKTWEGLLQLWSRLLPFLSFFFEVH